jgi:peroxiredoxin Q/BCP
VIVGVSPDSPKAQSNFKTKHAIPFTLLCDTEKSAAQEYGVLKEKNMYGKKVIGIERSTFVIDEKGRIAKIYPAVKAQGHARQVLLDL